MRKSILLISVFALVVVFSPFSKVLKATAQAIGNEKQIYVKVIKPFVIDKDRNTSAEFVNLPQDAIDFGLENMRLNGQIKAVKEGSSVSAYISWNSVTSSGTEQLTTSLKTPLRSKISGDAGEMVNVGEQFVAKGDLTQLAEKLVELDEDVKEAAAAVSEKTTEKTNTVSGLQPSSGSSGGSTTGSSTSTPDISASLSESDSVSYEDCEPSVNLDEMLVYKQQRSITTDENGNTTTGLCSNVDSPMPILTRDGSCGYRIDWDNKRAIKQEQYYYLSGSGQEISVGTCRDSGVAYPLEQYPATCETLTVEGKAIAQTRWGYNVNGKVTYVTDCVPTGDMDALTTTYDLCPDIVNYNTKTLTKQRKTNVVGDSGRVYSTTGCETYESYNLVKDAFTCGVRIDLPNMQVIDQQRWFYYDNNGQEVPLGDCVDSSDVYSIQRYYDQCPMEVDVENRVAKKFYKLGYIKNGVIHYIEDCQLDTETVPLTEEYAECEPEYDFTNRLIWNRHKLVLKDPQGNIQHTGECERYGDSKPILSKDGECDPRISFDQKIAVKKEQLYYMDDLGNEVLIGGCIDSATTYPIVGYPNLCSPIIEDGKATETTKWGYDVNGKVTYVTDCITTGESDNLSTRYEECEEVVDYSAKKLYKLRKSFLEGESGTIYQESDCEIYETYNILSSAYTCGFRIDMENKYAIKQEQWFYFNSKGEEVLIGDCRDSSDAYPIVKHYEQCEPTVDVENRKATKYFRWGYTYNGQVTYVSTCEAEAEQIPLTPEYIEADPEFDLSTKKAWKRRITVLVDADGKEYHRSGAERYEEIPLTEVYEKCNDFIDEANKRVDKMRITILEDVDGKEYYRTLCEKYDEEPILSKDGECTFRFDIENKKAVKMEQWYYNNDEGEEVLIGACRDSESIYDLVEMNGVCPNIEDIANGRVFPQTRLGFLYGSEQIFATECQPADGVEYEVLEEQCSDPETGELLFTHDFVNNVSYPMVRKYYTLPDSPDVKIFLNECTKSSTVSYAHKFETSACGWIMDDENLQAQQLSTAYIETPSGNVTIQECAARTAPVPYAYLGLVQTDHVLTYDYPGQYWVTNPAYQGAVDPRGEVQTVEYVVPAGVEKIDITLIGGGAAGSHGTAYTDCSGFGGGGRAGELRTHNRLTVTPGETITAEIGKPGLLMSPTLYDYYNTDGTRTVVTGSFGTLVAAYAGGQSANGYAGGNGIGQEIVARDSSRLNMCSEATAGKGYGAGGGGEPKHQGTIPTNAGGEGAAIITLRMMDYLRPDGTHFQVVYNGD